MKLFSYLFSWGQIWKPWLPKKNRLDIIFGKPIDLPDESMDKDSKLKLLKEDYIKQIHQLHFDWNEKYQQNRKLVIK